MKTRKKAKPRTPRAPLPTEFFEAVVESEEEELERQSRRYREKTVNEVKRARRARAQICREDVNEFCIFIGKDAETGLPIKQEPIHEEFQWLADTHRRLIVMAHPESGKALPLDTEIPTPDGWCLLRDIEVGSIVYGRDGLETRVSYVSPVQHDRLLYEIEFDDGVTVEADSEHRWLAWTLDDRRAKREPRVVTTRGMVDSLYRGSEKRCNWSVPLSEPIERETAFLEVDPYVLGVWLGDGHSDNTRITYHVDDREIFDRCVAIEGSPGVAQYQSDEVINQALGICRSRKEVREYGHLRSRLRSIGVLGDKHIPSRYLKGSIEQRLELLRGLLDTDGTCDKKKPRVSFTTISSKIFEGTLELIWSLGFKPTWRKRAIEQGNDAFEINFTSHRSDVFRLKRKRDRLEKNLGYSNSNGTSRQRYVKAIRSIESVPVKCIQVENSDHSYVISREHVVTHNTTQLGVFRPLWLLGNNPELRIAVVSKIDKNATKATRLMKEYIEKSEELAEVFPELLPGDKWEEGFFTVRRPRFSKDPSVQALGLNGSPTGSRIDVLIFDDVLDLENTMSPAERKKTIRRIRGAFIDRLSKNGVIIFLTNAWHPEDAAHVFEKEGKRKGKAGGWHLARFPVLDEEGNLSWAEKWDEERIEDARDIMGSIEFARAFLCRARDEGESPFDKDALEAAVSRADEYQVDLTYAVRTEDFPGFGIYHGVDLSVTKNKGSHLTSITSVLLDLSTGVRQHLWTESGRWSSREIADRIIDHERRYGGVFIVENNAAQRWIIDIVYNRVSTIPEEERVYPTIIPFTTGKQKAHPQFGVEGLAVEIARDDGPVWIFPDSGPDEAVREALELRGEMLYYSRGAHTGDRLMSLWFAREGCRRGALAGRPEKEGVGEHNQAGGSLGSKARVMIIGDDEEEEDDE